MRKIQHQNATIKKTNYLKYLVYFLLIFLYFKLFNYIFKGTFLKPLFNVLNIIAIVYYIYSKYFKSDNKTNAKSRKNNPLSLNLNNHLEIENPYSGVFISGGAGSGKSKSLVEPIIQNAGEKGFAGVVYDFKFPELAQYVASAYKDSEVQTKYISFSNINLTDRINPIAPAFMINESYSREFAYSILANLNPKMIKDSDFWSDNSLALLSAVFWYLRSEEPQYCTLPHAISLILQPNLNALLDLLASNQKCADMIATILTAREQGATQQLSGVISSLQVSLSKINTNEIYFITRKSDFDLDLNNLAQPIMLVVGNDPTLTETYSPIIGLILTSLAKQLNQQNKEKSIFLIDEFPTIFIPKVEQLPATGRSNKVATILACQDIAQMIDKYGKDKADTILSNLGNQFYGRTTNPDTAKRVSTLFGKADKLMQSINSGSSGMLLFGEQKNSTGQSYNLQERDLVKVQDVAQLNTGSFYTILSEGNIRQGKTSIPLNPDFKKVELKEKRNVTEKELNDNYEMVKNDVKFLLESFV